MLVYKDGITRTIDPREERKYKDLGYIEVKSEALKVEQAAKAEEAAEVEEEQPKGKRR